ncbi:hypothetical protein [Streptosporangium vulgare]|uniref:Chromosome segregation ATPase n=1 Tax=Streptosporangium vulgare TaxID=46190 RepID=A0ABV5TV30_9ACTN
MRLLLLIHRTIGSISAFQACDKATYRKPAWDALIFEISFRIETKSDRSRTIRCYSLSMTEDPSHAVAPSAPLETGPDDPDTGRMCARSGCANRLEPTGRGGGRRSGRPALYCGDACRSAAHRARTATHTPMVAEALRRTGALSGDLLAAGEQWSVQLAAFREALHAATTGALTQIDAAEQAAEEARAAAAAAEQRAADHVAAADRRATAAQDKAKAAIAASETAMEKAAAAQQRAEESERAAWRTAGEHESARTHAQQNATTSAERATTAERATRRITSERDALQGVLDTERRQARAAATEHDRQIAALKTALADRTTALDQAHTDLKAAASRAERAETAREKTHQEVAAARAETTQVREELATEREQLRRTGIQRDEARTAIAVAGARLEVLQKALEGAELRAQAAEQREEAAQQTINRLLTLQPPPQAATAEGGLDPV